LSEAPDLTRKVIGFRTWEVVRDGRLHSTGVGDTIWLPGPQRARCLLAEEEVEIQTWQSRRPARVRGVEPHPAPAPGCECGFYALHDPSSAAKRGGILSGVPSLVIGAVAAWGKLEVHHEGFRAEWVEPVLLAIPDPMWALNPELASRVRETAGDYGLELVAPADLEIAARTHGGVVPETLRPECASLDAEQIRQATQAMAQFASAMGRSSKHFAAGGLVPSGHLHIGHISGGSVYIGPSPKPPKRGFSYWFLVAALLFNIIVAVVWGYWWNGLAAGVCAGSIAFTEWRRKALSG